MIVSLYGAGNGSGMRYRDAPLDVGDELSEGTQRYLVERVEQPPNPNALGHAWVMLVTKLES